MLSENTAIIFLHRIKGFVYTLGTKYAYCAVRNESVYVYVPC